MTIDQVQERLGMTGADAGGLFGMLDGSSFMAKMLSGFIRFLGSTEQSRSIMKLFMLEMLVRADELLEAGVGGTGDLMQVLIRDRNEVVVADLEKVIEAEPEVRTVGVMYGAGHLPDMHRRLVAIGYTPAEDIWVPAIEVNTERAGLSAAQARQLRRMLSQQIDGQIRLLTRQNEAKKERARKELDQAR
jgi:hypothetical protein